MRASTRVLCAVIAVGIASLGVRYNLGLLRGNMIAVVDLLSPSRVAPTLSVPVSQRLVAHAGGAFRGMTYTNSREALDASYHAGFRVFELDFEWTSDGKLVLVHDWKQTSAQFCIAPHIFSYSEFQTRARCDGLTQLTFDDLRAWLLRHPDALVVTDTKKDNRRLFAAIGRFGSDIAPQLILQVYVFPNSARRANCTHGRSGSARTSTAILHGLCAG